MLCAQDNIQRVVYHYHFKAWPDHKVPQSPSELVDFTLAVRRAVDPASLAPIVVHCRLSLVLGKEIY
jgi:protein tyrosine phosphatase